MRRVNNSNIFLILFYLAITASDWWGNGKSLLPIGAIFGNLVSLVFILAYQHILIYMCLVSYNNDEKTVINKGSSPASVGFLITLALLNVKSKLRQCHCHRVDVKKV